MTSLRRMVNEVRTISWNLDCEFGLLKKDTKSHHKQVLSFFLVPWYLGYFLVLVFPNLRVCWTHI